MQNYYRLINCSIGGVYEHLPDKTKEDIVGNENFMNLENNFIKVLERKEW